MSNKVLIVEDENDLRAIYAEVLSNAGYSVDQAPDGESGMKKIKDTAWDILLLDIMLPGKDGLKMLREMKDSPGLKKGPIVVMTNLNSEHIIQESFNLGADGYLIKSEITPDKVIDEVKEFLK